MDGIFVRLDPNPDPGVVRVPMTLRLYPILYQNESEIRASSGQACLSPDGRSYAGKNQIGISVRGTQRDRWERP